jgi:hypothetical protein
MWLRDFPCGKGHEMKARCSDLWDKIFSDTTAKVVFIASIVYVAAVASVGWNGMLSELYAFRQTQTAITVSYLLKGGPWLAYETPVLGPPWSIPFEFPLYQWLVALVAKSGLFAVDQAGRFVSELFFFASLYPLFNILGFLKLSSRQRYLILALFCISPQYLFWSRTFMIESTALSLSIYFLWLVFLCREQLTDNRCNPFMLAGVALIGSLAGLVKVTTFFAFLAGACIVIGVFVFNTYRTEGFCKKAMFPVCLVFFSAVIVPFLVCAAWTSYADSLKELNYLASDFTSSGLTAWNFGTLEQKLSLKTWQTFYSRTLTDLVGNSLIAVLSVAALSLCRKERASVAIISMGLFLLPLMTFTNLQYVHSYYSYANGIFIIVAVGIIATDLLEGRNVFKRAAGAALFCLTVFFSAQLFFASYWHLQNRQFDFSPITTAVDTHSKENDVFIVFGNSWSSEIPYYINRRAAMIYNSSLNDPALLILKENLKGYHIGGLLFYTGKNSGEENKKFIENAQKFFNISPGFSSVYPWYKNNSVLVMIFNSSK